MKKSKNMIRIKILVVCTALIVMLAPPFINTVVANTFEGDRSETLGYATIELEPVTAKKPYTNKCPDECGARATRINMLLQSTHAQIEAIEKRKNANATDYYDFVLNNRRKEMCATEYTNTERSFNRHLEILGDIIEIWDHEVARYDYGCNERQAFYDVGVTNRKLTIYLNGPYKTYEKNMQDLKQCYMNHYI
ncbi:hypothetical protein AGMMS49525_08120 [Bacteroidia bacterium]|nr:hypothetical protein AGMMS49525_08120 [Bacteroidia bacterium]